MSNPPRTFGRAKPRPLLPAKPRAQVVPAAPAPAPEPDEAAEFAAWKQTRQRLPFPWRQLSLVAGLCFGIASLVLPDSVNNVVTYILYALAAISFFSGLRRRRKKPS